MKRYLSILALVAMFSTIIATIHPAYAQSQGVQKAFENVKESLDNLVSAKDGLQPMELPLRIETFRKVLGLAIIEAKDARVKLLDLENLKESEELWRTNAANVMKEAIAYFQDQEQYIDDNEKTLTIETVKKAAQEFKDWRETNYLPIYSAIRDYFLVNQQDKTIETARKRWQKIDADVQKLEKAKVKGIKEARSMLISANALILESAKLNSDARNLFAATYFVTTSTDMEATSTEIAATSTVTLNTASTSATSTNNDATSTEAVKDSAAPTTTSIRDIVKESLSKIRDAYNVFIDMSTLVRKLLK